ncbi:MAG: hypothetical protein HYW79_03495 [Parcubacteria group bacterium]|nr:hypothetical protein [Parcubacteria group bacterium]
MDEIWSMIFNFGLSNNNPNYPRVIKFIAKDDNEAKQKILNICKKIVSRMRQSKWEYFIIQAMPYLKSDEGLDGNRMIRVKPKYSNRRILIIKNPDKVLVQGYGSEALEKLDRD